MTDGTPLPPDPSLIRCNDLTVVAGYADVLRASGLDCLDALFALSDADRLSKPGLGSWRERLRFQLEVHGQQQTVYLKRFTRAPLSERREVRRSGSGAMSMAGLEWTWIHRLAADRIPCVCPIAFGESLDGGKEVRSAVLTAAVPGQSLERWCSTWEDNDRAIIRRLVDPLAELIARFHQLGYVHRDLYISHIFFDPTGPIEESLHLIDLQRVMRPRWGHRRWMVKDLASLNFSTPARLISNAIRLRWLTRYLQARKLDGSARRLVARIVSKTRRIAAHERRRQTRLRKKGERS